MGFLFRAKGLKMKKVDRINIPYISPEHHDNSLDPFYDMFQAQINTHFNQKKYLKDNSPHIRENYYHALSRTVDLSKLTSKHKSFCISHTENKLLKKILFDSETQKKIKYDKTLKYLCKHFDRICDINYEPIVEDYLAFRGGGSSALIYLNDKRLRINTGGGVSAFNLSGGILFSIKILKDNVYEDIEKELNKMIDKMLFFFIIIDTRSQQEIDKLNSKTEIDQETENNLLSKKIMNLALKLGRTVKVNFANNDRRDVKKFPNQLIHSFELFVKDFVNNHK